MRDFIVHLLYYHMRLKVEKGIQTNLSATIPCSKLYYLLGFNFQCLEKCALLIFLLEVTVGDFPKTHGVKSNIVRNKEIEVLVLNLLNHVNLHDSFHIVIQVCIFSSRFKATALGGTRYQRLSSSLLRVYNQIQEQL